MQLFIVLFVSLSFCFPLVSLGCRTMCPYGETIPNPNAEVTRQSRRFAVGDGGKRTCAEVEQSDEFQNIDDERECLEIQVDVGIFDCGCRSPNCAVCPDDSEVVDGSNCNEYLIHLYEEVIRYTTGDGETLTVDEDFCAAMRFFLEAEDRVECACAPVEETPCSFCADGGPSDYDPEEEDECFYNERDASSISDTSPFCPALQASAFYGCGCNQAPEQPLSEDMRCQLCASGSVLNPRHSVEECEMYASFVSYLPKDSSVCRFVQLADRDPEADEPCCDYDVVSSTRPPVAATVTPLLTTSPPITNLPTKQPATELPTTLPSPTTSPTTTGPSPTPLPTTSPTKQPATEVPTTLPSPTTSPTTTGPSSNGQINKQSRSNSDPSVSKRAWFLGIVFVAFHLASLWIEL